MELVATYPILYRSHQYEVGDSLPADDEWCRHGLTQEQPCGAKASRRKRKRLLLPPQQDWQGNPRTEKPQRM